MTFSQNCIYVRDHNQNERITTIDCNYNFFNSCVRLESSFPTIRDTDSYSVSLTNYNPFGSYNQGTAVQANDDDKFIKKVEFNEIGQQPFLFNYFGKLQESFVISSNGFITFDLLNEVGDFSTPNLNGNQIPNPYLPKNSIFGSFQDLIFSSTNDSEIYLNVTGEYPCRKLAINFYKGRIAGTDQISTFQIVLHEMTSQIEVNVLDKPLPLPAARFKESVIGIIDENGNGYAPTNRNTGIWSSSNESYIFAANGSQLTPTVIAWSNTSGDRLNNGTNLMVCDFKPSVYTATATYKSSTNSNFTIKNSHEIKISPDYPLAKDYNLSVCDANQELTQASIYPNISLQPNYQNFRYKFYLNRSDAENNASNFLPATQTLEPSRTYFVRMENRNDSTCFKISKVVTGGVLEFPEVVEICDNNNTTVAENYDLSNLNCQILRNIPSPRNVKYYVNGSSSPSTRYSLRNGTKVRVTFDYGTCTNYTSEEITIKLIPAPQVLVNEIPYESYNQLFDIVTNSNNVDEEPVNWVEILTNLGYPITNDVDPSTYKVFKTLADAENNRNRVNIILEGKPDLDYRYTWYLRIDNNNSDCKGTCHTIIPIQLRVKFRELILNIDDKDTDATPDNPNVYDTEIADVYLCADQVYNLIPAQDVARIFKVTTHNIDDLIITYHTSFASANNLADAGINPNRTTVDNTTINYYVRLAINDTDFVVKHLRYVFLPTKPMKTQFDICIDYQIRSKTIRLSDYIPELVHANYRSLLPAPIIEFYSDAQGLNQISNLEITHTYKKVWVKIKYLQTENTCEALTPIEFRLISVENILKNFHEDTIICDNNLDGYELINLKNYLSQYVNNPADFTFEFYRNYNTGNNSFSNKINNPENFRLEGNVRIYIAISTENQPTVCKQKLELKLNFDPDPLKQIYVNEEAHLLVCNATNDYNVQFDLATSIPQFFNNMEQFDEFITSVNYYESYEDAFAGNENFIRNINAYELISTVPSKIIYVRFNNTYGCFNIKPLNLTILGFIKFKHDLQIDVCDVNYDGLYEFDGREWLNSTTQDEDLTNDLLTDHLANRYADYKLFYTLEDYRRGNALPLDQIIKLNPRTHQTIIISGSINGGCEDYIAIRVNYSATRVEEHTITTVCDTENDDHEIVDLKIYENNHPNSTFEYFRNLSDLNNNVNQIEQPEAYDLNLHDGSKIYIKVSTENSCPLFIILDYKFKQTPVIHMDDYLVCQDQSITIQPDYLNWDIIKYEWIGPNGAVVSNASTLTTNQVGEYTLILTSATECTYSTTFNVGYKPIPTFVQITVQDQTVIVTAEGDRKILYSLDNITWQESNIFEHVPYGPVYVYLRYFDQDCVVGPYKSLVVKIHNTISPNGDGINDSWSLKDIHVFDGQQALFTVFDRYGMEIHTQQSDKELTWDGKINGKPLPSTSYWYTIELPDGRKYTGYINVFNKY